MKTQTINFVKMDFLKQAPYFDMLISKFGIYPLSWQSKHFTNEVVIEAKEKGNGLVNIMARMNGSEYFADISKPNFHKLMENTRSQDVRVA